MLKFKEFQYSGMWFWALIFIPSKDKVNCIPRIGILKFTIEIFLEFIYKNRIDSFQTSFISSFWKFQDRFWAKLVIIAILMWHSVWHWVELKVPKTGEKQNLEQIDCFFVFWIDSSAVPPFNWFHTLFWPERLE